MALSKTTQDHEEIRRWAEKRGARPAAVSSTESDDRTGIIRLEFPKAPHANDSALEEISWDEWFDKFDESGLEFTYQEKTAAGAQSNFNKLTYPEDEKGTKSHGPGRPAARSSKSTSRRGSNAGKKSGTAKSSARASARSTGRTAGASSARKSSHRTTGRANG